MRPGRGAARTEGIPTQASPFERIAFTSGLASTLSGDEPFNPSWGVGDRWGIKADLPSRLSIATTKTLPLSDAPGISYCLPHFIRGLMFKPFLGLVVLIGSFSLLSAQSIVQLTDGFSARTFPVEMSGNGSQAGHCMPSHFLAIR